MSIFVEIFCFVLCELWFENLTRDCVLWSYLENSVAEIEADMITSFLISQNKDMSFNL